MKYLNNFDKFSQINEDKPARAEKNKEKAEILIDDIENAIKAGDEKKANRLLRRAAKKVDRAEELNPSIDTEKLATQLTDLTNEIENPKDNFDMSTRDFRDKIKMRDFDIINKVKILGDEISNDELNAFLKTVSTYLNEYWSELKNNEKFPKEYQSPYTDLEIQVKKRLSGDVVFLYKEGSNDKAKIVFSKKDFSNDENKNKIVAEINDVLDSENLKQEIASNYIESKDDVKYVPSKPEQNIEPNIPPALNNQIEQAAEAMMKKDEQFISDAVKLLIEEKLNLGFKNTDEDKIFEFFKKNYQKCIVPDNIDGILIGYRKKKALMNEAWYNDGDDFLDATWGATKRATQSMRTQESKGVVGDLMWAFNTDARTLSNDINKMLKKLADAYQEILNKAIEDLPNMNLVKENMDTTSLLTGILATGYSLKKSPKLAKLIGVGRGAAARGAGSTVAKGGLAGVSRLGGLLANPYVWIGLAVVGAVGGGWYIWNSIDEQQNQLATILMFMWASGSTELQKEFKLNGIVVNAPIINISKLNDMIKSGEFMVEPTETSAEESSTSEETYESKKIKSFKDFIK